jgi:hypothetical protein
MFIVILYSYPLSNFLAKVATRLVKELLPTVMDPILTIVGSAAGLPVKTILVEEISDELMGGVYVNV